MELTAPASRFTRDVHAPQPGFARSKGNQAVGWLRRGSTTSPADVFAQLDAARRANRPDLLRQLCAEHESTILRSFVDWQRVPEPLRADPRAMDDYVQTIGTTAQIFAAERGHPELWAALVGPPDQNPIVRWQRQMAEADRLIDADRCEDAEASMIALIDELTRANGTAVPENRAFALGRLGRARFAAGRVEQALEPFKQALATCVEERDRTGIRAHAGNLHDCYRYLGDASKAGEYLEIVVRVLEVEDGDTNIAWDRHECDIVAAGEPLLRLIATVDDRSFELDELDAALRYAATKRAGDSSAQFDVSFVPQRNRPTIQRARRLAAEGRHLGESGRLAEALKSFDASSRIDPFDPDPVYNAAVTCLELERYVEAAQRFAHAERLAPGWFLCRRYRWLADRLALGSIDPRIGRVLLVTAEGPYGPREQHLLESILPIAAHLTWPWLTYAKIQTATGRRNEAIASLRRGLDGEADDDVRSAALVDLGLLLGSRSPEAQDLFGQALSRPGNLLAQAGARLWMVAS